VALGAAVVLLWAAVAVVSLAAPVLETGLDPTRIPLAAILSPIVAMLFTRYLSEFLVDLPATEVPAARAEPAQEPEQVTAPIEHVKVDVEEAVSDGSRSPADHLARPSVEVPPTPISR
jgi:hypothetical protein